MLSGPAGARSVRGRRASRFPLAGERIGEGGRRLLGRRTASRGTGFALRASAASARRGQARGVRRARGRESGVRWAGYRRKRGEGVRGSAHFSRVILRLVGRTGRRERVGGRTGPWLGRQGSRMGPGIGEGGKFSREVLMRRKIARGRSEHAQWIEVEGSGGGVRGP